MQKEGVYEFSIDSNAGGFLNVTDPASGNTIQLLNDVEGKTSANITLTDGVSTVYAFWKAVDGATPRLIVTWKGPGTVGEDGETHTDGEEVPLEGRHWTDTGPGNSPKAVIDDGDVKHGWGCRFYYYESSVTTLPNVTELLATTPHAAAKMDDINISSHKGMYAADF